MGIVKSITVGATLRFVAEVVAWTLVVMGLVWSSGYLLHGMLLRPGTLEFVVGSGAAVFGTLASRALVRGARDDLDRADRPWTIWACSFAMGMCVFLLLQGVPEIVRDVATLILQSRLGPSEWGTVLFAPALLACVIASNWWGRRVDAGGGAVFVYRWTRWLAAASIAVLATGIALGWILSRHPNPDLHRLLASGQINVLTPLVACLSALPRLRRMARIEQDLREGRCRSCGYDMTAIEDASICPECGHPRGSLDAAG